MSPYETVRDFFSVYSESVLVKTRTNVIDDDKHNIISVTSVDEDNNYFVSLTATDDIVVVLIKEDGKSSEVITTLDIEHEHLEDLFSHLGVAYVEEEML